ncbi:formate dehydrogenase subunit gamma [Albidovulum sp.]
MKRKAFSGLLPVLAVMALLPFAPPQAAAQTVTTAATGAAAAGGDRAATGGAQTLEDILARQKGLKIDDSFRRQAIGDPAHAAPMTAPLGTLGGVSDPELWRALRYDEANVIATASLPGARTVIQSSGMTWLAFRRGPLVTYGGGLLLAVLALLLLFYLIRGRIRLDHPATGRRILRFAAVERFSHWLMAGSFILLGLTGLVQLMGRPFLIPLIGKEAFAPLAQAGKWVHNNVAWAFMIGLVLSLLLWIRHNLPDRSDLVWLARGGGLFTRGAHPPARKFNAGQKIFFWIVMILGASVSVSGLSLLFPFELPLFAASFDLLNQTGLPQALGFGALPTVMPPQEEMQLAQAWHAIVAFAMMAVILAHIYIGSVGMEGALDAMVTGEVDVEWAKEHHSLWFEEATAAGGEEAGAGAGAAG